MNHRIHKLQGLLQKNDVDGVLYATSGNLQYFLNDASFWWQRTPETGGPSIDIDELDSGGDAGHFLNRPDCILYVPASDEPVLIMTYQRAKDMQHIPIQQETCFYDRIPDVLGGYVRGKRIACGESCNSYLKQVVARVCPDAEILDGEHYGEQLRKIKDEDEIATLRKAAAFTDEAMAAIVPAIRPGATPRDIENLLVQYALDRGLSDLAFSPACICVRSGAPGSEEIFGHPHDQPIVEGTAVTFDFGYVVDGYCSDFGRAFYCGRPEPVIADAYKALQEAHCHLLETVKPGMKMDLAFRILTASLEKHNFGKYLRDYWDTGIMGHQIGIDVHERPWLHNRAEEVFEAGMVMCIEPKIWYPGKAYLRVEDMVLLTGNGCESLTKFDRELFELPV
ncbi:MAG: M24 family metallopeptidase [Bacillota bacterium]|nr:aminopeptidase P family protein [Candidatus Fermentithermobacillaceae bacterium]